MSSKKNRSKTKSMKKIAVFLTRTRNKIFNPIKQKIVKIDIDIFIDFIALIILQILKYFFND